MTDHFDGRTFHSNPPSEPRFWKVLKWRFTEPKAPWPDSIAVQPSVPEPEVRSGIRATWVGHATVLLQTPGLNLLTDPVWARSVGPWEWIGSKRKAAPGVRFEDLPRIDAVLLSHDHYDHADLPTLRRLAREKYPVGVAPLGTADLLRQAGFERVVELDWWQSTVLPSGDTVTLVPARHWSIRWPWDRNTRLWGGYVVSTAAGKVYFAGDTGDGPHFEAIGTWADGIDLALIPIGAFQPRWFMAPQHIGPVEARAAARCLRARESLAIHWGTFDLANDGPREAVDTLSSLGAADPGGPVFRVVPVGGAVEIPASAGVSAIPPPN